MREELEEASVVVADMLPAALLDMLPARTRQPARHAARRTARRRQDAAVIGKTSARRSARHARRSTRRRSRRGVEEDELSFETMKGGNGVCPSGGAPLEGFADGDLDPLTCKY